MLRGRYRDVIRDCRGQLLSDSGWRRNTVVGSAWPLMAALLKNDPAFSGILFWAVGAGDAQWDSARPSADPSATQLAAELDRAAVPAADIDYLDDGGATNPSPTNRLEVAVQFQWPVQAQTLREFGLYGGDASLAANSGRLIDYVVHARIDLAAGATLSRRLRLNFAPVPGLIWLEVPTHWLGDSPTVLLDGVGRTYATTLSGLGIDTISQLAGTEPTALANGVPLMKFVEVRARARHALRSAADIVGVPGLEDQTAWDVIGTPPATLAANTGASLDTVQELREQLSALQLALDTKFLRRTTVGELAAR